MSDKSVETIVNDAAGSVACESKDEVSDKAKTEIIKRLVSENNNGEKNTGESDKSFIYRLVKEVSSGKDGNRGKRK